MKRDGHGRFSGKAVKAAPIALMDFGGALKTLRAGKKVARAAWDKISHIFLIPAATEEKTRYAKELSGSPFSQETITRVLRPYINAITTKNECGQWNAEYDDLLAEDWKIVE